MTEIYESCDSGHPKLTHDESQFSDSGHQA